MKAAILVVGAGLLVLPGCVSKTLYLQKLDEALRASAQAESYKKELLLAAEVREKLRAMLVAEERKTSICEQNRTGLKESRAKVEATADDLRERLKKTSDDVNELRTRLALLKESAKGCEARVVEERTARAAEARKEPDLTDVADALRTEVEASSGGITILRPKGEVVVRIRSSLLFEDRTARTSDDGKALIARLADILGRLRDRVVRVEGYQDAEAMPRRRGTPTELAITQAYAVALLLVRAGLPATKVSSAGLGGVPSLAPPTAEDAIDQTRRIELHVTPAPPQDKLEVIGPEPTPAPTGRGAQ